MSYYGFDVKSGK
jgi:hypothetical protein